MMADVEKLVESKLDCGTPNTTQAYREIEGDVERLFALVGQRGYGDLTEEIAGGVVAAIKEAVRMLELRSH